MYSLFLLLWVLVAATVKLRSRHRDDARWTAVQAFYMAKGRLTANNRNPTDNEILNLAVELYKKERTWHCGERALKEFIVRMLDRPLPPIPDKRRARLGPNMTDRECAMCIRELRNGFLVYGKKHLYSSLDHAAQMRDLCPTVAKCRLRYSPDDSYGMWRRLREYDPDLLHIKPTSRATLSPKTLAERARLSAWYLQQIAEDEDFLKRIFFIDQKTITVHPETGTVIGYKRDRDGLVAYNDNPVVFNPITGKKEVLHIEFYAMVNWHSGLCGFIVCQGTTGEPRVYRVGNPLSQVNTVGGWEASMHAFTALCRAPSHASSPYVASSRNTPHPFATPIALHVISRSFCTWGGISDIGKSECVTPST